MDHILDYQCYRKLILDFVKSAKTTQRHIALESNIHTSYFSRVMKNGTEFSEEQLYSIAKVLGLSGWRLEYFLLLGSYSRSGHYSHKNYIENKISEFQRLHSKVGDKLRDVYQPLTEENMSLYYQEACTARIHMLLTIPKYRTNLSLIRRRLHLGSEKLEQEIKKLVDLKIIERTQDRIRLIKRSIHLDEDHPVSIGNHRNWRIETLHKLGRYQNKFSDYHLSATFSCDEKTKQKVKEILKKAVVMSQGTVREASQIDEVFHIGIDLY